MTTVTTPRPSWNPNPPAYTQGRYRTIQVSSTWRRFEGNGRPVTLTLSSSTSAATAAAVTSAARAVGDGESHVSSPAPSRPAAAPIVSPPATEPAKYHATVRSHR